MDDVVSVTREVPKNPPITQVSINFDNAYIAVTKAPNNMYRITITIESKSVVHTMFGDDMSKFIQGLDEYTFQKE